MKIVSDALETIAASLDLDYIRSMSETEADVKIHNLKTTKIGLLVYNGASDIQTTFEGAMIYDNFECQIFVVIKQPEVELSGEETDTQLQITKELTNQIYSELNKIVPRDIEPYSAVAVRMFTDIYVGHDVTMIIPFYNEGCSTP